MANRTIFRHQNYIKPTFGEREPNEIIPLDVDRLRLKLLKSKSPGTVKNVLELLRRIINFGLKKNLCDGPGFTIEMSKVNNIKTEDLSQEQLAALLDAIEQDSHSRAEAQTLRLSMIYASLDQSDTILQEHLESGLAMWRYCEKSAQFIFSGHEIDPKKNRIIAALKKGPRTTTELHKLFCGHLKKDELNKMLRELQINARIEILKEKTKGKPRTLFRLARIPSGMRQLNL